MPNPIKLPDIPDAERTPLIEQLVALIETLAEKTQRQAETIQQLREAIAVLKGEKGKPTFKPSGMEDQRDPDKTDQGTGESTGKRAGSNKRSKTPDVPIHEDCLIGPTQAPPPGSRVKGYRDVVVQDLKIEAHNTRDRLEVWQTPDGEWLRGALPPTRQGQHVGPTVRADRLDQHHHCHVTQPLLREQLLDWGIDLSVGQIDALLSGHNEAFFTEKDQLLAVGLEVSTFITVDDSGARHQGRNGYVTQIGNDFFAWFSSAESKSRINFLQLLQAGAPFYGCNDEALVDWCEQGLPQAPRQGLADHPIAVIASAEAWEKHLDALGMATERHRRIATEGALLGGLLAKGLSRDLVNVSDGAGQFAILLHA